MIFKSVAVLLLVLAAVSALPLAEDEEPQVYQLRNKRGDLKLDIPEETRGRIAAEVNRNPQGTQARAEGDYNLFTSDDRRTTVDAKAHYEQRYDQPRGWGPSRPSSDWNTGIRFEHRFGG